MHDMLLLRKVIIIKLKTILVFGSIFINSIFIVSLVTLSGPGALSLFLNY